MSKDNVTGIVLDIPPTVLDSIKDADKYIKQLEATSRKAAQKIKGHFDNTMVSGVTAFIKKVNEAQTKLGSVKMPTIDATGLSAAVQELSRAMSTIDKSATTGSNRLTRIADAMSALQTANPNPQLFQNIADGIAKIGNTSQQTIDNVRNLSQIMAQLARDIRTVQQAQAAQNANTASAAQYNKLYKEQADLIRQITALKGKGTAATATDIAMLRSMENRYAEINKQLGELNRKKQTAASILAQNLGMERTNRATPSGAIAYAQQAKSLKDLQDAYKNLKAVMATVDPKTTQWHQLNSVLGQTRAKIDEIKKKMGEFKSTAQGVGDIAGQLKRSMAAVFSVSAISGYINKMIQVRAEFELQQTALRAILQNKAEADRIFMQVQQMALQSPFSILQLTTYTKQLAAYRIESEKLVGTTKMLADVSAGLGVSIDRLILAYGQVKAANYLRATEVRQFTEAGLNIAGELAQYFSELQGKMISVGDVMEMITKRMVRFEDVEEVFKRVTSAGGLFYDMQKKQSETLRGQLQRINDAMSIMFNEIGKSNQDAISAVLTTIRSLISNWRTLAVIIKDAAMAMGIFFAAKGIAAFVAAMPKLLIQWKSFVSFIQLATSSTTALKAAMASLGVTGWGAIIAGVALLATTIYQAVTATSALQEELSRIGEESMTDMFDLTAKFKEMANVVRDATAPYEERKKALEDLHNTFKNILPAEMLELENIQKMSDGYKEATEAIRVFSAEQARRKAMEAVQQDMAKQFQDVIDETKKATFILSARNMTDYTIEEVRGILGNIMRQIQQELGDGTLKTIDDIKQRVSELSNMKLDVDVSSILENMHIFDDIEDILRKNTEATQEFNEEYTTAMQDTAQSDREALQNWQDNYQLRIDAINRLKTALENMRSLESKGELYGKSETHPEDKRGLTDEGIAATDELLKATNAVNSYRESVGLLPLAWQDVKDATISATNELTFLDGVQKTTLGGFLGNLSNIGGNKAVQGWAQDTTRKLEGLSAPQLDIINKGELILSQFKLQPQLLDKLKISAETNYASAAKDAKGLSDQAADNIAKITSTMLAIIKLGQMSGKVVSQAQAQAQAEQMWGITLDQAKKEKNAWDLMAKMWGKYDKAKKKSSRKGEDVELKRWKDIQKAIEEANKSYEKYRAKYNVAEANAMIEQQYGKIFKELGVNIKTFYKNGTYDAEQLVKALGVLRGMVKLTTKDRQRYATELAEGIEKEEVEIKLKAREEDLKKFKQDINSIFDNYELSQTFAKLGVNIDVVYSLGGKPTKLSDIKRQLADMKEKIGGKAGAEDEYKTIEEAQQRLGKLEQKYAVERAKNYVKYLTESLAERAQIEVKAAQDINKIQEDMSLDAFSKEQAINNRRKKMNEDLAKVDFDEFKASDVYISVFKDLEQASRTQLQYVINKLREFQSTYKDLSPTQVKAIAKALKETEGALAKQSAFKDIGKNLKEAIKYARERQALQEQQVYTEVTIDSLVKSETEQSKQLHIEQEKLNGIQGKNSDEYKAQEENVRQIQLRLSSTQGLLEMQRKKQQEINGKIEDGEAATDGLAETWNHIVDVLQSVSSALSDVAEGLELMGLGSDALSDGISSAQEIIGSAIQAGSGAVKAFTDPNPWSKAQGALQAFGGAIKLVGSLFNIGDKKKERQIKRLQEHVENLQKAYDKLGNEIKRAYEYNDYKAGYEQSLKNLEEQKKAIQEQINLEKSKKNVDEDKVKEYEDALEKIAEDERSLRNQFYEDWGSYGDDQIKSAGEDFVSTWLDAFKETGDGLDALNGKWDEFFENLIMRQAASAVVNRKLKKYIDRINAVLDSSGLSEAETAARMKEIIDAAKNEASTMNDQLKNWFSALGIKGGQGELLLSDLQKGIQNITEPQAAAIEAYLNSMRFAVFEQNNIMSSMLEAIQAQYGTGTDNPILSEVKAIRNLVANIDNKLSKVIVNRNSTTGNYIVKVG